jgi:hypothetical protein
MDVSFMNAVVKINNLQKYAIPEICFYGHNNSELETEWFAENRNRFGIRSNKNVIHTIR